MLKEIKSDPFLWNHQVIKRLIEEYNKHGNLIIGLDFDNTIFDCHEHGHIYPNMIKLIKDCNDLGLSVCLWTMSDDHESILKTFEKHQIKFDHFNKSPLQLGKTTHKPYFSLLLDDRAGLASAWEVLTHVIQAIKSSKKELEDKSLNHSTSSNESQSSKPCECYEGINNTKGKCIKCGAKLYNV